MCVCKRFFSIQFHLWQNFCSSTNMLKRNSSVEKSCFVLYGSGLNDSTARDKDRMRCAAEKERERVSE